MEGDGKDQHGTAFEARLSAAVFPAEQGPPFAEPGEQTVPQKQKDAAAHEADQRGKPGIHPQGSGHINGGGEQGPKGRGHHHPAGQPQHGVHHVPVGLPHEENHAGTQGGERPGKQRGNQGLNRECQLRKAVKHRIPPLDDLPRRARGRLPGLGQCIL